MKCLIFILSLSTLLISCDSKPSEQTPPEINGITDVEDFNQFYERFHNDTAYQMLHINFPLQGMPQNAAELADEEKLAFRWQKEDWVHHNRITNENFKTEFEILDKTLITEYISHKKHNMGMMRRFSKSGDDWNLIYYIAINPLQKE